ncbi:MAG: DNA primase [Longimicrobiales bacterium]
MIPDSLVEEVRARADIVEIIGESVSLKRAGKDFKALCPFHHEKTPSFYVVPDKGFFKCFGCGESGDVFTFLMKRTGVGFTDIVRQIAARVGVELPAAGSERASDEPNRALYGAIAFAADYYAQQLESPGGQPARRYLEVRGITQAAITRFGIGYAPDEWRSIRDAAHAHGMDDDVLLAAGLIKESERSEEPYDRFRDRIIFPIAEVTGRTVAFGGRALRSGEGIPKYLNSPETAIYQKGHLLYGLNWSKPAIRRDGAVLVVEGYMDYVSLAARGVENVVAPMGTALTVEQANLIARYTAKAYLLYDSDAAGLRASFKSADALLRTGVHPLIVSLPAGEDPDSLVRKKGAPALRTRLEDAVDVLERKLQMLDERGFFGDIDGRRRALDRLLPTIRAAIDPALRDIYISRVAERTGVRPETLAQETRAGAIVETVPGRWSGRGRAHKENTASAARPAGTSHNAERDLLLMMVKDPARVGVAAALLDAESLRDPVNRALFDSLVTTHAMGGEFNPAGLDAPIAQRYSALRNDPIEITDGDIMFEGAVAGIRETPLWQRLDEIEQLMHAADDGEATELIREKDRLRQELLTLHQRRGFKASRRYRMYARERAKNRPPATDEE